MVKYELSVVDQAGPWDRSVVGDNVFPDEPMAGREDHKPGQYAGGDTS